MLKAGRERREVGFPTKSKESLARQCGTWGEISYQKGLMLLAYVSDQAVIQALAYLEVPGLFMGLKLTRVYALLDWDYSSLPPASRERLLPFCKAMIKLLGPSRNTGVLHKYNPNCTLSWPRK